MTIPWRKLKFFCIRNNFWIVCGFIIVGFSVYHRLDNINFTKLPPYEPCDNTPYINNPKKFTGNVNHQADVPDIIHFVRFGIQAKCIKRDEVQCLLAAWKNHKPNKIYIHTDEVNSVVNLIKKIYANEKEVLRIIDVKYYPRPNHMFGLEFNKKYRDEQEVDFTKLKILRRFGGIYLNSNVYLLKNLKQCLNFEMTILVRPTGNVSTPTALSENVVVAHKDARFLHSWLKTYHQYDQKWGKHIRAPVMKTLLQNNRKYTHVLENHVAVEEVNEVNEDVYSMLNSPYSYFVTVKNENAICLK